MKDRRKASFKVNHAVSAQILGLFIGHALQRLFRLHDGNRVRKALQIFGETSLICSAKKPLAEGLGIVRRKLRISHILRQLQSLFAAAARHPDARAKELWEGFAIISVSSFMGSLSIAGSGSVQTISSALQDNIPFRGSDSSCVLYNPTST